MMTEPTFFTIYPKKLFFNKVTCGNLAYAIIIIFKVNALLNTIINRKF